MKIFSILLFLACFNPLLGQQLSPKLDSVLNNALARAEEISLYADKVDWDKLKVEMFGAVPNAEEVNGLKPAFELMLNAMGDRHGAIRKLSDYSILASMTDASNAVKPLTREFDPEIWKVVNDLDARFSYELLPEGIGYLKVVGVGPQVDPEKEVAIFRKALATLKGERVKKWIVDLRYNGGGTVNVMLAGLAPLLDQGKVIGVKDSKGEVLGWGEIAKGDFSYFEVVAHPAPYKPKLKSPQVAVLTSRWTASSGEMVAIAFKGQKNTRSFGEKTGGYLTNNSWDPIGGELMMAISTGAFCDRTGKVYHQYVAPDVEIPFEVVKDKTKDEAILAATKWLQGR